MFMESYVTNTWSYIMKLPNFKFRMQNVNIVYTICSKANIFLNIENGIKCSNEHLVLFV